MAETFLIIQKKSDSHGQFANLGYHVTHPHLYMARDTKGNDRLIMSRVGNYKMGSSILIPGMQLTASSKYFVDDSGSPHALAMPAAKAAPPAAPLPAGITLKKEIMVVLTNVSSIGNFREAAGTIFYLPDGVFPKDTPAPVTACIKEGKEILVRTDVSFDELERYRTFLKQAFGFAGLHNVRVPGVVPGSNRITADHTGPKPPGYVSQDVLDRALRP